MRIAIHVGRHLLPFASSLGVSLCVVLSLQELGGLYVVTLVYAIRAISWRCTPYLL